MICKLVSLLVCVKTKKLKQYKTQGLEHSRHVICSSASLFSFSLPFPLSPSALFPVCLYAYNILSKIRTKLAPTKPSLISKPLYSSQCLRHFCDLYQIVWFVAMKSCYMSLYLISKWTCKSLKAESADSLTSILKFFMHM